MGQGISQVLTFAIGVAISPVPIIAVILMLFSGRAKVNGPMFLAGWMLALGVVSSISWGTSCSACSSCSWPAALGEAGRHRAARRRCRSGWRASTLLRRAKHSCSVCCWPA
jgi:hypothetical protein